MVFNVFASLTKLFFLDRDEGKGESNCEPREKLKKGPVLGPKKEKKICGKRF